MASIVLHGPSSNKRKNRINSARLFDFGNSAISGSENRFMSGAFRDNIRIFLQKFGEIEDYTICNMTVWCTALASDNGVVLPLYVMEETVENSLDPFCEHCDLSGWGHHFVCKRRYRFIIPVKQNRNMPLDEDFAEIHSNNLHGLIHCNGYGHLISISSSKTNTKLSAPDDIMELWDRLCSVLNVRSISAHNITRKEAIDRNLIHGAAYGKSWLEKWGYKSSTGRKYNSAIRFLGLLRLDKLIIDLKKKKKKNTDRVREMIDLYRKSSENPLVTVGDLLKIMLTLKPRARDEIGDGGSPMGFKTFVHSMSTQDCRWSAKRLEFVLLVIVNLLKQHNTNSMSRQDLRDEARKSIGDTGLIDFVLKCIKSFAIDNLIIRRAVNPFTRLAEFTVLEASRSGSVIRPGPSFARDDLQFLCEDVLGGYVEHRIVLSSNVFLKNWPMVTKLDRAVKLVCKVLPSFEEMETELTRRLSPGEVVVVNPWITIADLKKVAQCALRDTYCVMDEIEVIQIGGLRMIDEDKVVSALEPGSQVWVRGQGLDLETRLRYEDGGEKMKA
ncbi:hypothetical protein CASFOL_009920 [Castilleja foliolosa]|uniref:Uncharacterized protein n=1 Tax=Castilleja foliolosa TaxID=1961234 RepID=A0ABD3DV44_9LAMI